MSTPPAEVPHLENMPMELKPPYKKFLSLEKQQALDEYVVDGLRSGLLEYVKNPTMASPAVILKKKMARPDSYVIQGTSTNIYEMCLHQLPT